MCISISNLYKILKQSFIIQRSSSSGIINTLYA